MNEKLILKNNLRETRINQQLSQKQLAEMVGVSRNTISSIETGQYNPTAKLALILCIALDTKFENLFYFWKSFRKRWKIGHVDKLRKHLSYGIYYIRYGRFFMMVKTDNQMQLSIFYIDSMVSQIIVNAR